MAAIALNELLVRVPPDLGDLFHHIRFGADGPLLSVQAGRRHCCTPQANLPHATEYTSFEVSLADPAVAAVAESLNIRPAENDVVAGWVSKQRVVALVSALEAKYGLARADVPERTGAELEGRWGDEKVNAIIRDYKDLGVSHGYIGNIEPWGDERSWYVFTKVPKSANTREGESYAIPGPDFDDAKVRGWLDRLRERVQRQERGPARGGLAF
jgi:hypothetical protein